MWIPFKAAILDAAERSIARRQLGYWGRENTASEDRLLPQQDRDTVTAKCHDLRRNNPVISGACDRIVDNVIGSKIVMQARSSDEAWNNEAERWLTNWMAKIDPQRRTSMTTAARLTVAARLYDGEIFHQPTKDGWINIIEAERVRPPTRNDGVSKVPGILIDSTTGEVKSWCVHFRDAAGGFSGKHEETWINQLFHPSYRWRPDQIRGWPQLASVANMAIDIQDINNANLRKSKMGANAAWVYQKGQAGGGLQGRTAATSSTGQPLQKFREGQIYEIEQGASLAPFQNNQPGSEYQPFMEFNLRMLGMALGLPYEFLLLYFGGGNFASAKASLLQAYKTIEGWQNWTDEEFIHPVVSWRIAKAIRDRELPPAPVDKYGVSEFARWEWQRPGVEWIDPQNAIQTEMQEVRMGASDMYAVCGRRGRDAEDTARNNARYLKMLERVGAEEGVDPARLHAIQIPGQTPTITGKPTEDKQEKPDEDDTDDTEDKPEGQPNE